jgi:phospholipid/cholesterol/gamma-HCH transport system substrate-binding protein
MKRTRYILFPIGMLGLAICLWVALPRIAYSAEIKTYFADVHGLREGAKVDVAGVQVGKVKSIKVVPNAAPQPVEVVMSLSTKYPLKIPSDAVAFVEPAGVLGDLYVEIDIRSAHGIPITSGAVLKSLDTPELNLSDVVKTIANAVADNGSANSKSTPTPKSALQSSPNNRQK